MIFVMEDTAQDFHNEVFKNEKVGREVITGSFYIKSLETDVLAKEDIEILNDVHQFYAVTLRKEGKTQTVSVQNDPDTFYNTINVLLDQGAEPVVGSLYMEAVKLAGYIPSKRQYQTWYCCFMT